MADPDQLADVGAVTVGATSITWDPVEVDACSISYAISIVRDVGSTNIEENVQEPTYAISETDYCFTYTASVKAIIIDTDVVSESVNSISGTYANSTYCF